MDSVFIVWTWAYDLFTGTGFQKLPLFCHCNLLCLAQAVLHVQCTTV